MLTAVIVLNCCLAIAAALLAWRLWQLRRTLRLLRWMLKDLTRDTEAALQGATAAIVSGQQGAQRVQWRYRHAQHQLMLLKRLLIAISWAQSLILRTTKRRRHKIAL